LPLLSGLPINQSLPNHSTNSPAGTCP